MSSGASEGSGPSATEGARAADAVARARQEASAEAGELWRRRMLERVLWLAWLAQSLALAAGVRNAMQLHDWSLVWPLAVGSAIGGIAALHSGLDLRLRAAGLYLGTSAACIGALANAAFHAPNAMLGLLMVVVLLGVGVGPRAAWWALAASTVVLIVTAYVFVATPYQLPNPALVNLRAPANWARVITIFVTVTSATLLCVTYVTSRLESAMLRRQALLDALAAESEQRLEALERQRTLFQQLQHAQKLEQVGTLTGGVAHDFNNLLLVILSHAQLLRRRAGAHAGEIEPSVQAIEEAARRSTELTKQLLQFSRRQSAAATRFDLDAAVERSLGLIRRLLPASIALEHTRAEQPIALWGAQVELDQVVMNLCVNARDAMPEGGRIEVACSLVSRADKKGDEREYACVTVSDSGTGISKEQQARIFDPFFTTKPPDQGTGLGLSVVQGIVVQWEGAIEVESAEGAGTTMRVYLPRGEGPEAEAARVSTPLGALRGRETVLLADDEPRVREATAAILTDAGYRVLGCADGVEALARYRVSAREVALLVTDAVMPRLGGRELHDAISVDAPDLPCIVCSGYAAETVSDDFLAPGRREFLAKPFTAEELLTRVRRLLDAAAERGSSRPVVRALVGGSKAQ